eukprot:2436038-Amphidinium_carterae.1
MLQELVAAKSIMTHTNNQNTKARRRQYDLLSMLLLRTLRSKRHASKLRPMRSYLEEMRSPH